MGGNSEVAARHQLQAGGGGQPLDLGDDRFRAMDDGLHERRAVGEGALEEHPAPVGIGAVRRQFLEVMTGAEQLSRRGEDDDAHGLVVAGALDLSL